VVALVVLVAAVAALAAASVSASPQQPPPEGTFRIGTTGASWQTDPALTYISSAWQLEYATCAKLVNYPDAPPPEGTRLRPEIAAAMPDISQDRRIYTFQIRDDYAFSPPASGVVTAQSMKYTFERTLNHDMASPAAAFLLNIEGAREYNDGQADEITGIVAQGSTLTITLIEPQGEFLTFLAMPFLCAVPIGLPPVEQHGPIPSAGPYYISAETPNVVIVATRNPNYHGPRPHHFESLEYNFNLNEQTAFEQVLSGELDYGPVPAAEVQWVADLYGPDSPAAPRGLQQFFPNAVGCVGMLPMNTSRPLFADVNMRKAVNYAVDRTAYGDQAGPYAATPHDQYLPPGMPGYEDIQVYPDHPDLERARELAGWHPGDPLRPITVYYRSSGTINPAQYQIVRQNLIDIGFDVTGVPFSGGTIYDAISTRGEPFDLAVSVGWCEDYHDPWDYIQLFDGTTIHDGGGNNNWAYFDDPVFNERMHAAADLIGDERYDAFEQIEHDLVRDAAPWAAMRLYNNRDFFSQRIGCQLYNAPQYAGADFANLCVRPAITTDDATVLEPATGTTTVPVTVHLSSEMDGAVTVDYATQDGTAHAGADYVATSGTLTFAPHERARTVSVTVNSDYLSEPSETFFLNLSNESSGTMVDGQAVVTILDRPVGPPPPGPPPPPPPPPLPPPPPPPAPPPPPPPPPRVRCVVPRVIGLRLARARTRIRARHCSVGRIRRARSRRVGRVIGQSPRPGTVRARGAKVRLVVGRR
jgi:peptide/nickel transport system substrate-binding protein